jgi:hypothetical protein
MRGAMFCSWQSLMVFSAMTHEMSFKFNILYPFCYVLRVSKKRVNWPFCNDYNIINIILLICFLYRMLIVNSLQRVQFKIIEFSILNSKTEKFSWLKIAQFLLFNKDTIYKIIVHRYAKNNHCRQGCHPILDEATYLLRRHLAN